MSYKDYFTKGTKQHKIKNILLIISPILFLYLGYVAIFTLWRCIDFPCHVDINQGYIVYMYPKTVEFKYAELFISSCPAHSSGGGCIRKSLSNGESTDVGGYHIKIDGDKIVVNDAAVNIGQSWHAKRIRFDILNPWWIYEDFIYLRNEGFVKGYKKHNGTIIKVDNKALIITGDEGTNERFNIITLIIFLASVATFIVLLISSIVYKFSKG